MGDSITSWLTIVGIGEDGVSGLGAEARDALARARVLVGGARHLAMIPDTLSTAPRIPWTSPMAPVIDMILTWRGQPVCVVASGDPMLYGVGSTFARRLNPAEMHVIPHVSAFALACARMGWPEETVALVSMVGRPLALLHPHIQPGRRIIVFSADGATPAAIAALLRQRGYGASRLTVLSHLAGPAETRTAASADDWPEGPLPNLNTVAVECQASAQAALLPTVPGLPDDAFLHDGQITKREVRAITLARLMPVPGQLLWDVGAGSGSVAIEWMRIHPSCQAVAIERSPERAARIAQNAVNLGVPTLQIINGEAPRVLEGLPRPDAVFIGGGLSTPGLFAACWQVLAPGGRLVANAVTLEGESELTTLHGRYGGEVVRIAVGRAEPVGRFFAWRQLMPVTIWATTKLATESA